MLSTKSLYVHLIIALVAVSAVMFFRPAANKAITSESGLLFPDLKAQINDVSKISVKTAENEFVVEKKDNRWVLPDKANYDADIDTIRSFVLGVSGLKILEEKTSNKELYAKLGVQDIGENSENAGIRQPVQYALLGNGVATIADLLVGNDREVGSESAKQEIYVRRAGEAKSWLVEGSLSRYGEPLDWLDKSLLTIDQSRIKGAIVQHQASGTVVVSRPGLDVVDHTLNDLAEDEQIAYQFALNDIANRFASLTLEDVVPYEAEKFSQNNSGSMQTFDGLRVDFQTTQRGGSVWFHFEAAQEDISTGDTNGGTETKLLNTDEVGEEVESLNALWSGWMYQLPKYAQDAILKPRSELVEPREEESSQSDSDN